MQSRRVGHFPPVDNLAFHVDEVHGPIGGGHRSEQREAAIGVVPVHASEAYAAAFDGERLDRVRRRCRLDGGGDNHPA